VLWTGGDDLAARFAWAQAMAGTGEGKDHKAFNQFLYV